MREYLPLLIVGAIIGTFTLIFVIAYALAQNKKETMGFERNMADRGSSSGSWPTPDPTGSSFC